MQRTMANAADAQSPLLDRRKQPRVDTAGELRASVPVITSGDLIDISGTGALLSTTVPLKVGDRTRLSLLVGREPFGAWARVVRCEEGTRSGDAVRYHLGLTFTSVDAQSRQVLDRFVRPDSAGRS